MHSCHHHKCQNEAFKKAEELCQNIGARFTDGRRDVFSILWQSHKALTAADVMAQMENPHPPITYRALDFLSKVGLIHHIVSLNAYIGCSHKDCNAHTSEMLICTSCKTVLELKVPNTIKNIEKEAQKLGFTPQTTHIEVLGTCEKCA